VYIKFKSTSILLVSILLATACSQGKGEITNSSKPPISKEDCLIIASNLESLSLEPKLFEGSENISKIMLGGGDYLALNLGEENRQNVERYIINKFSFLDKNIEDTVSNSVFVRTNLRNLAVYGLEQALAGTKVEFPFPKQDLDQLILKENYYEYEVEPVARELFGDSAGEYYENSGCASYDDNQETSGEWQKTRDLIWRFSEFLYVIRSCQKFGQYAQKDCAWNEPGTNPDNWTLNPVDPWTKEWDDKWLMETAKTVWCIRKGLKYDSSIDACD